jgi:single-strand DNA-binding protein
MQQMQNRVTLVGYLGSDINIITLTSGKKVGKASIATHSTRKLEDGTYVENTQWHNLVGWGARAEYMGKRLKRGSYVIVYGRLVHRTYEDKEGNTRYISEIVVREFDTPKQNATKKESTVNQKEQKQKAA